MLSAPSRRCLQTVKHLGLVFPGMLTTETLYLYLFYDRGNCQGQQGQIQPEGFRCLEMFGVITLFAPETIPLTQQTEIRSNP